MSEVNGHMMEEFSTKAKLLGEVCEFEYGKALKKENRKEDGRYPVYGSNGIVGFHDKFLIEAPAIIVGRKGAAGEVHYANENF